MTDNNDHDVGGDYDWDQFDKGFKTKQLLILARVETIFLIEAPQVMLIMMMLIIF